MPGTHRPDIGDNPTPAPQTSLLRTPRHPYQGVRVPSPPMTSPDADGAGAAGAEPSAGGTAAAPAGTFTLGGDLPVRRMGFGAMRITGEGIWGEPDDPDAARALLRRAVELGVSLIDTADAYGPQVSERLIAEALHPY